MATEKDATMGAVPTGTAEVQTGAAQVPAGPAPADVSMSGVPADTADVTASLSRMQLSAAKRGSTPAKLPSDDSLLVPVKDKIDPNNPKLNSFTFHRGNEFLAIPGNGNKTAKDMDNECLLLKYNDNYYTKKGLWDAIKHPDTKRWDELVRKNQAYNYKNQEFRQITASCGLTAVRDNELFEVDRKVKEKNGKPVIGANGEPETYPIFKLDGEAQKFNTEAGIRLREVAAKNPVTSGEQLPDIMHHMSDGTIKGFSRLPDDAYTGQTPHEAEAQLDGQIRLKSKLHGFQTLDNIERTQGQNAAANRFADYTGENRAFNKDTATAYIKIDRQYFPIKDVITGLPDDLATKAATSKPSLDALEHRMLMRMPEGNTFATPDFVKGKHSEHFAQVCEEHGVNSAWGDFKPKWNDRQDKHSLHSRVVVEEDGILSEVHYDGGILKIADKELPTGKSVMNTYGPDKVFYEGDARYGGRSMAFTSLAQTLDRATQERNLGKLLTVPDEVTEMLMDYNRGREATVGDEAIADMGTPQPPPGYRERPDDRLRGAVSR